MRLYKGEKLVSITCNKCGNSTDNLLGTDEGWVDAECEPFREFDLVYGYGSVLYDFSGVKFDLCEHCIAGIVGGFKIPAERRDYEMKQGYNSEGRPFVYYGFDGDKESTQEELDEMYKQFMNGNKEDA